MSVCLPLAAPIGLSPVRILTLCGSQRRGGGGRRGFFFQGQPWSSSHDTVPMGHSLTAVHHFGPQQPQQHTRNPMPPLHDAPSQRGKAQCAKRQQRQHVAGGQSLLRPPLTPSNGREMCRGLQTGRLAEHPRKCQHPHTKHSAHLTIPHTHHGPAHTTHHTPHNGTHYTHTHYTHTHTHSHTHAQTRL